MSPATPTEIDQAGLYVHGAITADQLMFICGDADRAIQALDATIAGMAPAL